MLALFLQGGKKRGENEQKLGDFCLRKLQISMRILKTIILIHTRGRVGERPWDFPHMGTTEPGFSTNAGFVRC